MPSPSEEHPSPAPLEPWVRVALGVILAVAFVLRVIYPDTIFFNIHAERDVWRTIQIMEGAIAPHTGSELTQGGRTMGPALYFLQIPPLLFTLDPRGLLVWLAILHTGAIALLFQLCREHFSARVGLLASALFATFPLAVLALRYTWNPSYIFPFTILFYWALLDWMWRRRTGRIVWIAIALSVLFQVHLSAIGLMLLTATCAAVYRPPLSKRSVIASAIAILLIFSPYIIGEVRTGFANTRVILIPPEKLETGNESELPVLSQKRVFMNKGAMMALQAAVSPVFYDRRWLTGSFSYLHLLGEFGPIQLHPAAWNIAVRLHQLRWGYIGAYGIAGALLLWIIIRGRDDTQFLDSDRPHFHSPRKRAWFFVLAALFLVAPMIFTSTSTAIDHEGNLVGIGAIRYYFVFYPIPFILLALLGRSAARLLRRWTPGRGAMIVGVASLLLCALQAFTVTCSLYTGNSMGRSFKYSLYEAFNWRTLRGAADILVRDWGVSPDQFDHQMDTLDDTFRSTRWDIIMLEESLDYAYYTHPELDTSIPARHPDDRIVIYDCKRTPSPDLSAYEVIEQRNSGDLVLVRVKADFHHRISPIQNIWQKMRQPKR